MTRHLHPAGTKFCETCEAIAEERANPDTPSDLDQDMWSGRYEDAYGPHGRWVS